MTCPVNVTSARIQSPGLRRSDFLKIASPAYIAFTGLVAIATMMLAWPRLAASYRYLPVDIAISRYFSSREIPSDRLGVLIRFASEAAEQDDSYRYHDGLSLLHLLRALDLNTPALERRDAYLASMDEAKQSLQRAPAQPATWLRLANVRWVLHEEPEDIVAPWKMSIFTGRTDAPYSLNAWKLALRTASTWMPKRSPCCVTSYCWPGGHSPAA